MDKMDDETDGIELVLIGLEIIRLATTDEACILLGVFQSGVRQMSQAKMDLMMKRMIYLPTALVTQVSPYYGICITICEFGFLESNCSEVL